MMHKPEPSILFPLLATKCPHCLEIRQFALAEQVGYWVGVFGMKFGRMVEYQMICSGCGYHEFVKKKDFPLWESLAGQFATLSKGDITHDQFGQFLEGLDLPELENLIAAGKTWECACGESNPPNFIKCWKCESPSPVQPIESPDRPIDIGGGHPWER